MDCDAPATYEELRAYTSAFGAGRDAHLELWALAEALADDGCPVLEPDVWSGSCTTADGYEIEGWAWADGWSSEGRLSTRIELDVTITATASASGTLPTGTLALLAESASGDSSESSSVTAAWSFDDPATFDLGAEGDVSSGWSWYEDRCAEYDESRFAGHYQGCDFDVEADEDSWPAADGSLARQEITVGTWTASVVTYFCDSLVGTLDGRSAFLDDDWLEIALTDADGDHCPVETCDCDDADAGVSPTIEDTPGDLVDSDCDGTDYSAWTCHVWWSSECGGYVPDTGGADTAEDTGADSASDSAADSVGDTVGDSSGDTASASDTAPTPTPAPADDVDTIEITGGGCSTPDGALLLALAALFRRRR